MPTGLRMFSAHAGDFLGNRAFQLKMALLLTAGMNAAIFHTGGRHPLAGIAAGTAARAAAGLPRYEQATIDELGTQNYLRAEDLAAFANHGGQGISSAPTSRRS